MKVRQCLASEDHHSQLLSIATSAIDYKTDTVIQSSLRNELKGDVTLITVAHRLQTIMDADRIVRISCSCPINVDWD